MDKSHLEMVANVAAIRISALASNFDVPHKESRFSAVSY